jgi:hypothetical protein
MPNIRQVKQVNAGHEGWLTQLRKGACRKIDARENGVRRIILNYHAKADRSGIHTQRI